VQPMHSDSEGDVPATVSLRSAPWCKISIREIFKILSPRPDGLRRLYVRAIEPTIDSMYMGSTCTMSCHLRRGCQLLAVCRPVQRQEAFSLRQVWAGEVEAMRRPPLPIEGSPCRLRRGELDLPVEGRQLKERHPPPVPA
jgi:hypothetical protein